VKAAESEIMVSKRNENESVGENVEEINESVSNGQSMKYSESGESYQWRK
jgi:hypothetical protein